MSSLLPDKPIVREIFNAVFMERRKKADESWVHDDTISHISVDRKRYLDYGDAVKDVPNLYNDGILRFFHWPVVEVPGENVLIVV